MSHGVRFAWILWASFLGAVAGVGLFIGPAFIGMGVTGEIRERERAGQESHLIEVFIAFALFAIGVSRWIYLHSSPIGTQIGYAAFIVGWFWLTYFAHGAGKKTVEET